ncbi:MAG TPA: hypothetical protein VI485_13180 [Vicinamibacterales bacterium]|nr:hypothetical protein [Vicinamibacterales bacterium]
MTKHWMSVALLGSALVTGCAGSSTETTPNPETTAAAPAAQPSGDPAPGQPAATPPTQDTATPTRREPTRAPQPSTTNRPSNAASPSASNAAAPEPAARPAEPPPPVFRDVSVPVGNALSLTLITPLSSETAKVETPVTARVRQAVVVDGVTVIPAGATLHGDVIEVERAGRVKGRSHLAIRFTEMMIDGQRDQLRTNALSFDGEATKGEDATKVGAGAGIGALIGGIVGGKSGAAKGAAIGGAAGAGTVVATRGREVELAEGTELNATLASPYSIRVQVK